MKNLLQKSIAQLLFLFLLPACLFGQFKEELVEIKSETDQLVSIKVLDNVDYISQMLGGVAINSDDDYYIFTSEGGDTKLITLDILTGAILYEVDVPQIQMIQYVGTDELVGMTKLNPSDIVSLSRYNYKTGAITSFSTIPQLEGVVIDTHNSAIDPEENILYFVGSIAGTNTWSVIAMDYTDGSLIKIMDTNTSGTFLSAIAFDQQRKKIIGLINLTSDGLSLVEFDPQSETLSEIKKLPQLINIFGGHRYWAYDDLNDRFFVIGHDNTNESYLYVLDSSNGTILFQHIYEDDVWIMEEHAPLELRYNPSTEQLLGLRKGDPLPVSLQQIQKNNKDFKLFPNPTLDRQVGIEMLNNEKITAIQILDANGRRVYNIAGEQTSTLQLDLNQLASGIYYVLIQTEVGQYYQKLTTL